QRAFSNRRQLSKTASMGTKGQPPGRKKRITPRSASSSFITRGRKNVYWGKFRKGERPITTDITGRTLRAKNFHSPGLGVIPANEVYRNGKKFGDRSYSGTFKNRFVTSGKKSERAWSGDVSGHAIRTRPPKVSPSPGDSRYSGYLSNSGVGRGRGSNRGSVRISRRFKNNGQPILVQQPGIGASMRNYSGNIKGQGKTLNNDGIGYSGLLKGRRPLKGGGSNSRGFRNNGQPINVKAPGIGANMGNYSGFIKGRVKTFDNDG